MSDVHEVIGTEDGDIVWITGHVHDRDERRRILQDSEWVEGLTFLGAVKASRSAKFSWMVLRGERYYECEKTEPDAEPWTRIEVPGEDKYWW